MSKEEISKILKTRIKNIKGPLKKALKFQMYGVAAIYQQEIRNFTEVVEMLDEQE